MRQHTLREPVEACGIGVHSAEQVRLILRPAGPNTGIVFRRTDLTPPVEVVACAANVTGTNFATTLAEVVSTVEHLLAALSALQVDNAIVELDGAEVPIMDGSAEPFVGLIRAAGLVEQPAERVFLRIKREVTVSLGDKTASFEPYDGYRIALTIAFAQPVFAALPASRVVDVTPTQFAESICRARTFGFLRDVEALRSRGLARGGSQANAVVLEDDRILNPEGLRCDDEFVLHKVLDVIGDLALLGMPLLGQYRAYKPGHTLNHAAIAALLAQPDAFEWVTFDGVVVAPTSSPEGVA